MKKLLLFLSILLVISCEKQNILPSKEYVTFELTAIGLNHEFSIETISYILEIELENEIIIDSISFDVANSSIVPGYTLTCTVKSTEIISIDIAEKLQLRHSVCFLEVKRNDNVYHYNLLHENHIKIYPEYSKNNKN
jgi:hypothetical protein